MNRLAWSISLSCEQHALDKSAAPPPWPATRCVAFRVDSAFSDSFVETLGKRWLVVINDLDPSRGPKVLRQGLNALLAKATWIGIETEPRDELFYRDLCVGADLGARVVLVSTDEANARAWEEYRERHPTCR